jgi:colicin import membrane protein
MSAALHRDEPGKFASGVMAVVVHVAFFALLVVGVSWQHRAPSVTSVDLWSSLPPVPAVKAPEPPPAPKPEAKPPPPPPEPKPVPKLAPKPAPEPKPAAKPDIALEKEKQEKARREREEREKAEVKKREEREKAEAKKREDIAKAEARKKEEIEKKRLEVERAREREAQEAAKRLQQQQAAAQSKEIDLYRTRITEKIRRYVNKEPCATLGNPEIVFEAVLLPDGNTLDAPKMLRSSGNAACDQAVLRAVLRAQPLPLPPDPALFPKFRELKLEFRPNE